MKYLALILFVVGCSTDKLPDDAATKECQALFAHLAQVTGKVDGDPQAFANSLPFEDYEGCRKSEPEIRTCMMGAADTAAVKKCLPPDDILECMTIADKARDAARKQKKVEAGAPDIDAPFDAIRKKCYAGDAHAAKDLKVD